MDVEDQAGGGYTDEDVEGRVPMGRFARPEDVAQAVAFFADPEQSAFVNGHTLAVDGGWESLRRCKQGLESRPGGGSPRARYPSSSTMAL
jgi:NAD(P)-dependent dehydrogenase (short-subunit alcohol dehydrogenase family)